LPGYWGPFLIQPFFTMQKICTLFLLLLLGSPLFAATIYVDASRPDDSGDGLSWATARKYLQTALTAAQAGDQIWVAQGTYKPTTNPAAQNVSFAMKEGVAIYGGFTSGQMNLSDRNSDPETNNTILSGDIDNDGTLDGNSFSVILNYQIGLSSAAVLDGFTLTGGNAQGAIDGGAMNNRGGSAGNPCNPYISRCLFRDNYAINNGAAVFNDGGGSECNPQFVNCTFRNNTTGAAGLYGQGAAVYNAGGYGTTVNPQFINCTFQNNSAGFRGGAVMTEVGSGGGGSLPTFTNCSFQGNRAGESGGALGKSGAGALAVLNNCVFWDNGSSFVFVRIGSASNAVANYNLFDSKIGSYSGSNNLTTTVNPFVSSTSTELRVCSPAIDAGSDALYTGPGTDLAGNARTVRTIDMGAYEFQSALPVISAILSGNAVIMPGETGFLTVDVSGGTAPYSVVYSDGSTNQTVSNYQSGADIPISPSQATTYTLVSVTDANGCVATVSGSLTVQDVRCGNKQQNVTICYYGVTQCVSEKIAARYLKLGATLGGCGSSAARVGVPESSELTLSLISYPNPVQDVVTVEVLSPSSGEGTFEVVDLAGLVRQSRQQKLAEGLNEVEFRLGSLPGGVYLIRVIDALGRQGTMRVSRQ
jgi:hypothetical protein